MVVEKEMENKGKVDGINHDASIGAAAVAKKARFSMK